MIKTIKSLQIVLTSMEFINGIEIEDFNVIELLLPQMDAILLKGMMGNLV